MNDYDYINPSHYCSGSIETIDKMVRIWGKEATATHCEMCAFKYRERIGLKPDQPVERELEKIKWYENKAKELRGVSLDGEAVLFTQTKEAFLHWADWMVLSADGSVWLYENEPEVCGDAWTATGRSQMLKAGKEPAKYWAEHKTYLGAV